MGKIKETQIRDLQEMEEELAQRSKSHAAIIAANRKKWGQSIRMPENGENISIQLRKRKVVRVIGDIAENSVSKSFTIENELTKYEKKKEQFDAFRASKREEFELKQEEWKAKIEAMEEENIKIDMQN